MIHVGYEGSNFCRNFLYITSGFFFLHYRHLHIPRESQKNILLLYIHGVLIHIIKFMHISVCYIYKIHIHTSVGCSLKR